MWCVCVNAVYVSRHDRLLVDAILAAVLSAILPAILRIGCSHGVRRWIRLLVQSLLDVILYRLMLPHSAGDLLGLWHWLHVVDSLRLYHK